MKFITDEQVRRILTSSESSAVIRQVLLESARGQAVSMGRDRTKLGHVTLSVMGGIVLGSVCGVKVYSTIDGQFDFVIVLFDVANGRYLATVQGNALTEFRTAACTRVAVEAQLPPDPKTLTIIGTGVQAKAHLESLLALNLFKRVNVVGRGDKAALAAAFAEANPTVIFKTGDTDTAVSEADVLVTCTRSTTPLFDGNLLKDNVFVAAIGSSKPQAREIDDVTLARSNRIIVENKEQARQEAGDLLLAADGIFDWDGVYELGQLLASEGGPRARAMGITVYKSVGIGLLDVALSNLVLSRTTPLVLKHEAGSRS